MVYSQLQESVMCHVEFISSPVDIKVRYWSCKFEFLSLCLGITLDPNIS